MAPEGAIHTSKGESQSTVLPNYEAYASLQPPLYDKPKGAIMAYASPGANPQGIGLKTQSTRRKTCLVDLREHTTTTLPISKIPNNKLSACP